MKKLAILCAIISFGFQSENNDTVYICEGKSKKTYHLDRNCSEIKNYTHGIKSISKSAARELRYTQCRLEY